jgi:hypothetical protein
MYFVHLLRQSASPFILCMRDIIRVVRWHTAGAKKECSEDEDRWWDKVSRILSGHEGGQLDPVE